MKYYSYSGKKSQSRLKSNRKKIIINILIIVLVIALCVAFALILGNHLRKKLEAAPISTEPVEELIAPLETEAPDPAEGVDFVKNDRAEGEMSALFGYLDLEGCPDEESAQKFVYSLKDNGYTGMLFCVRRADGSYAYASKAASEMSRIAAPNSVVSYDCLNGALYTASTLGMRSAAYIDLGDVFAAGDAVTVGKALDRAVVKELSAMGFSEIVFDGLVREELTIDYAKRLYTYVSGIRADCPGTDFGLVIDPSVLENPEMTPPLEIVFRFVDFFALDLTDPDIYTPEAIGEMTEKFSGSFGAYSILSLIDGSDVDAIRRGVASFSSLKALNAAFVTPKSDYEAKYDDAGNAVYSAKIEKYSLTAVDGGDDTSGAGAND